MKIEQCRRLKNVNPDKNVNEMVYSIFSRICRNLDGNPETCNWRKFLTQASNFRSCYNLSITDVKLLSIVNGSPSEKILYTLGTRGLKVYELVYLLDKLRLERVLMPLKQYEPIIIVKHPPSTITVTEGDMIMLEAKGRGFPYPRYQWFKKTDGNWIKLRAETNHVLKISYARNSDIGEYCCRLHNGSQKHHATFSNRTHVYVRLRIFQIENDDCSHKEGEQNTDNWRIVQPESRIKEAQENTEYIAQEKVALIIGNSNYMADTSLQDVPKADVHLMTATFKRLNFTVFSLVDLTKLEINNVVHRFIEYINMAGKDVYVVFCFFGHGFEDDGICYLVPTDAIHGYGTEDCVCADDILKLLQTSTDVPLIVMVLDTCRKRNNSWNKSPKNKPVYKLDSLNEGQRRGNTVVLYSTSKYMQAYQDSKNGFLARYFAAQIQNQYTVIDVITALQEDMKREFEKRKEHQIPEFKSNLAEPRRSFHDKIQGIHESARLNHWAEVFASPDREDIYIPNTGVSLRVEIHADMLNEMNVDVQIVTFKKDEANTKDDFFVGLESLSKHVRVECKGRDNNVFQFIIKDLQKLQGDLVLKANVVNVETDDFRQHALLNLHRPLISRLNLWRNTF